jgi:hypothetical protein
MASPDEVYREYVTRTHRTMAAYLSMFAWTRKLDCVALERDEIVRFWGLAKRVENQRLDWLKEDIEEYFPYVEALWFTGGTKKFGSVFLARRKFPEGAFSGSMTDKKRALALTEKGFPTAIVPLPAEVEMLTQLTGVIHGLARVPLPTAKTA